MKIGESKREVRTTWIGFTVIFAVFGSILLYKGRDTYVYFYGASAFFAVFAAAAPMALLPLYRLWVKFATALAWFNTRLLLGLVYYVVITPLGLSMRLLRKDQLKLKLDKSAGSYWIKKEHHGDMTRYEKPY